MTRLRRPVPHDVESSRAPSFVCVFPGQFEILKGMQGQILSPTATIYRLTRSVKNNLKEKSLRRRQPKVYIAIKLDNVS